MVRSHISGDGFVYAEPNFDGRGRNLPHVRVALDLEDALKIIDALADKGDPRAECAKNACKLAFSIADLAKNSD
jgi:hypothetical protein